MADEDRYTRITLRIPKDLVSCLKESSEERSHSMNAEIVQRLEDSFTGLLPGRMTWDPWPELPNTKADIEARIEHIRRNIAGTQLNIDNIVALRSEEFTAERAKSTIGVLTEIIRQNWSAQIKEMENSIQTLSNKLEWVMHTKPTAS